ncbi:DUF6517 family protein [Natronosalvus rutilus]|uniref:DUF6517 family protein n=1 Tax=Natronosalvus rutilus TaxID=2953753 RepID=A0A9E7SSB3_9EURY|nr:DUF6517 family protein [Natronosalvus rutilus]UTF52314.1 DUF6517 family protein [Natronosalvus rutilus]
MINRRSVLAGAGTGVLAATAGCLDFLLGNEPLEYTAEPVLPAEATLESTGYAEYQSGWQRVTEEAAGREIAASAWSVAYTNEVTIQGQSRDAAVFAAISMPEMSVGGKAMNPLADMDTDELLEELGGELEGEFDGLAEPQPTGESFALGILGANRTVDEFASEAQFEDERLEITLWVTKFTHDDDLIVLVGGFPTQLPDEGVYIEDLMRSVEHPASRDVPAPETDEGA